MTKEVDPHEDTRAESIRPGKMVVGHPIGGYELIAVLGEGGMGVVWSAHDPNLDRMIAIKVLRRTDAAPALRKRLLREARAMARLKHPNVLTVYEVGTEGDRDFIAMEMVDGGSLDEWLDRHPPKHDVMVAILAAGRGLAAAHAKGLVHRDFKPHNVLRSRDGRVLVTDFGLARGMGEESSSGGGEAPPSEAALDVTLRPSASARTNDSLLDSPLTHTGAMIGTPAYMAPEQFVGGAPDPRTDQFAFCVTAWQALTGARPYTGATLDELRKAASTGVSPTVKVDLPPDIRAALVRGLDPDPQKRWPTLDDLLDALDHAVRPRRPRWVVPVVALALVGLVGATILITRRDGGTTATIAEGCAPGEDGFAEAWSPRARAELAKLLAGRGIDLSDAQYARIADPLDAYRARWTQAFATACKAPEKLGARQRACLLAARDQTAALALVLREGPPPMYARIDLHGMLPDLGGCEGDAPNAPPHPPTDPQLRGKVVHLLAKALSLQGSPDFLTRYPAIEEEARTVGWAPMLPIVRQGIGNELLRRGEHARARVVMQQVIDAPSDTREPRTVAIARFGLLDASLAELAEPDSAARPGELHHEIARLLRYVSADVKAAGNEPTLVAALAGFEARAWMGLAQWGRYPKAFDEALAQARKAAAQYHAAGDQRRAARLSALAAEIILVRGGASSLDDAMFEARAAGEALVAAKVAPVPQLDQIRAVIERQRGEFALAQQLFTRTAGPPQPPTGPARTGTVSANGKPVANARVVAWRGELAGDPTNVVTDPGELTGEMVETAADGTFTVHAGLGDAIITEFADRRSRPILVTAAPLALKLETTGDLFGTADRPMLVGVAAEARYGVGANTWSVRVPVAKDRAFHLAGLPPGVPLVGTIGDAGQGRRRNVVGPGAKAVIWPLGEAIEVIGRGPVEPGATAWVFRGTVTPARRADAEGLAEHVADVGWATLVPIGADNTDAGRAVYAADDRHAVITGNLDGNVSVCLARGAAPEAAVACKVVAIKQTALGDPGDGPHVVGVTTVILADEARGTPAP